MKQKHAIYAGLLAIGIASTGPAMAQLLPYPPAALPPQDVVALVRSTGLEPVTRPVRHGPAYVLQCGESFGPRGPGRGRCPSWAGRARGSTRTRAPNCASGAAVAGAVRQAAGRYRGSGWPWTHGPRRRPARRRRRRHRAVRPCRGGRPDAGAAAAPNVGSERGIELERGTHDEPVRSSAVAAAAAEIGRCRAGRAARICSPGYGAGCNGCDCHDRQFATGRRQGAVGHGGVTAA